MENQASPATTLLDAAISGDVARVRFLLAEGVDADANDSGYTALYRAISARHEEACEVVQVLLEAGADPNKQQGNSDTRTTPLGLAAGFNLLSVAELLLKAGADVNGACALHIAATQGNVAMLKMLIAAGGNVRLSEPDSELGEFPIDVFELVLAHRQSNNKGMPDEDTIREVRKLLAL